MLLLQYKCINTSMPALLHKNTEVPITENTDFISQHSSL